MPNTTINVKHGAVPQGYLLISMRISNVLKKNSIFSLDLDLDLDFYFVLLNYILKLRTRVTNVAEW